MTKQQIVVKVGRIVFGLIMGVLVVSLMTWEIMTLRQAGKRIAIEGKSNMGDPLKLAVEGQGENQETTVAGMVVAADARPEIIRRYLQRYKSPLLPYTDLIFELSQTYGFDYYWIVAVAQQESNLCKKIPESSYNCWGYGIHKSGTLRFDNYELALRSFAEYLKREYFDKGLNTPELMMKKYCPNSNGSWAFGVEQFIEEMKSGDF